MTAIQIGPLALPTAPLLLLGCTLLAAWLAQRLAGRPTAASLVQQAVLAGLLLARVVHLLLHAEAYRAEPWAALDLRDGGWHPGAGLAGALGWLAWQARRHRPLRRALAAAGAAGLALWGAGTASLALLQPRDLPDLVLTDLASGQPVRLRDVAAQRPLVLNLWASWCGPCRAELPVLVAAQARHADVLFVFANQGERAGTVRAWLQREGLAPRQVLLDAGSALGPAVGSAGLPTTVFYDRDGRRVDAHLGALSGAALAARLTTLRAP